MTDGRDRLEGSGHGSDAATEAWALAERVKEMRCLLEVSRILASTTLESLDDALATIARLIPAAWQYPDAAQARLRSGDQVWTSDGHEPARLRLLAAFADGEVEVSYRDSAGRHGVEFLPEEEQLLEAIAERIGEAKQRLTVDAQMRFHATMLDQVEDAVVAVGPDGRIEYWNRGAEQLYGWPAEEAIGRHARMLIAPDTSVGYWANMLENVYQGRTPAIEALLQRKDGSTFPGAVTQSPIRDKHGRIKTIVGITRDLSRYKQMEEQLRQAQKLEALGQLTGGIAHDFNNLLTVIIGNVDLLLELVEGDAEAADLARQSLTAATRGADLTRRLLAFSRRQTLAPKRVDLWQRLRNMEDMLNRTLGEAIELTTEAPADLWTASVDPVQLDSAVLNLCLNARDAMPQGGHLRLTLHNAEIGPDTHAQRPPPPFTAVGGMQLGTGDYVVLTVADTGTGMSPEILTRVFDPFFTTKEVGKGSGLGLSMVHGFVSQSGGDVRVCSAPGKGTVIELFLPRALPDADVDPAAAESVAIPRGHGEYVLLVEDQDLVRDHVSQQLTGLGYRVQAVRDAQAAMANLAEEKMGFDLLFSDIILPGGVDGFELARRARELYPELPVLFTTGYLPDPALLPDDAVLLRKPYLPQVLAQALRDALIRRS